MNPCVIVYHKVHEYRQGGGYMMKMGYYEGMSKVHIERIYRGKNGGNKALETNCCILSIYLAGRYLRG
jgi:hypothetical protein